MSWHKIVFPLSGQEPFDKVFEITSLAQEIHNNAGNPEGFGIFNGWESSQDNADTRFVVYFSPVASQLCSNAFSLIPCDKPDPASPGFGRSYGAAFGQIID